MFWWTFQSVAIAALLAGFVLTACRVCGIGPVGRHALWLIVLLKLVAPPVILLQWPWEVPAALQLTSWLREATTNARAAVVPRLEHIEALRSAARDIATHSEQQTAATSLDTTATGLPVSGRVTAGDLSLWGLGLPWVLAHVTSIWLVGAFGIALIQCVRIARVVRTVRVAGSAEPWLSEHVDTVVRCLRIRSVRTRVVAGIESPLIWCGNPWRPQLLWPAELAPSMSADCRHALILHELAHVKRRDHWVGWLELAAGCACWWNPLFWYVRSQVRENAELACDGWVISERPDLRRAYAEALLAVCADSSARPTPIPVMGVGTSNRRLLERRLAMIMRDHVPLRLSRVGWVGLAVVSLAALPAWAQRGVGPSFIPRLTRDDLSLSPLDQLGTALTFDLSKSQLKFRTALAARGKARAYGDHSLPDQIGSPIEELIDVAPQNQSQQPIVVPPQTPVDARSTVRLTLDDVLRTSLGRNHSVSTVHNAYWDLVYATEAVDSARQSLALATRLVEDNTIKVEVGTLAKIDITSAQAAAAQRNQAIIQAENNRRTLELSLKRLIVTGSDDPNWLATIDPIDRPEFRPASTDLATAIARARRIDPLGTNDITGAAITLGQAAESIQAAQATRERSQQRLEADQKRFDAGLSTNYAVVQAQRELSETRLSELRAVLNYRKAQVEFDRLQETAWNMNLPAR